MTKIIGKSFVLYCEVDAVKKLVNCVYLFGNECRAQPILNKEAGYYKPTEDDLRAFCTNVRPKGFRLCPRAAQYREHLRAIGLEKPE